MSLTSLISSPEPTFVTSPRHSKCVPIVSYVQLYSCTSHDPSIDVSLVSCLLSRVFFAANRGQRANGQTEDQQESQSQQESGNGSGCSTAAAAEQVAPATVAMWTAISNPLLLISHVLRKSMELEDSPLKVVNDDEFVIERHAIPDALMDDKLIQTNSSRLA